MGLIGLAAVSDGDGRTRQTRRIDKGLVKNTTQLHTLFGLANLIIARRRILALNGQVARCGTKEARKRVENGGEPRRIDQNTCLIHNQSGLARPRPVSRRRVCREGALISGP